MGGIEYRTYNKDQEETELQIVKKLVSDDLSEPYSIYVYRYFIYEWPELCFLVSKITCMHAKVT
jgi:peptide alpha-N-acetyltransferase